MSKFNGEFAIGDMIRDKSFPGGNIYTIQSIFITNNIEYCTLVNHDHYYPLKWFIVHKKKED